jgi:Ca-activated chloride channel family protein
MDRLQLIPKPAYAKIDGTVEIENYLLLEITGAPIDGESQAPPLDLIALVDISSSMASNEKMDNVKQSLKLLVKNLSSQDAVTLITYSDSARVILSGVHATEEAKPGIAGIIDTMRPFACTNFSSALGAAYRLAEENPGSPDAVKRIIFFTDGCPTAGVTNKDRLLDICAKVPGGRHITTMGYGLQDNHGHDIDVDFLKRMAGAGRGNFYYMKDADTAAQAFASELGGLISTVAQDVVVRLEATSPTVAPLSILEDYKLTRRDNVLHVEIPDILADETKLVTHLRQLKM